MREFDERNPVRSVVGEAQGRRVVRELDFGCRSSGASPAGGSPVDGLPVDGSLSGALCRIVVEHHAGAPFDFERTMVLVPGAPLANALERKLLARAHAAGVPLIAPSIVTPLMLGSRFVAPARPILPTVASRLSWRATLDRAMERDPELALATARVFGVGRSQVGEDPLGGNSAAGAPPGEALSDAVRARLADRLQRLASEVASAMWRFGGLEQHPEVVARPEVLARIATLARLERLRDELLDQAGVADRDGALRDAIAERRVGPGGSARLLFDRLVVLLADPEPVQRVLLARLEERGVCVEVCVHTREGLDGDGFPQLAKWESRGFGVDRIPHSSITVAEGPADGADAVVRAMQRIPAPRRSDEIAVMAPDEASRRAIEQAIGARGIRVAGARSRSFEVTRIGTLLLRLGELVGDGGPEAFAAFVRHDDVASWLGRAGMHDAAGTVTRYRAETLVGDWNDAVVRKDDRHFGRTARAFEMLRDRVRALVGPLAGVRPAHEWGPALRTAVSEVVGEDLRGSFDGERAATVAILDRTLAALAATPAGLAPGIRCDEAVAAVLADAARREIRSRAREAGLHVIGWLDAGMADEPHLVFSGFCDGAVPEGAVTDSVIPDEVRRMTGMRSSLRRAARDAWILDGILARAHARGPVASVQFVVPRRTDEGDPLRPSRFLLRVGAEELPARAALLFGESSQSRARRTESSSAPAMAFPITPPVKVNTIRSIRVTAFKTFIQCPYLFQLQSEPRLRLRDADEFAAELDPSAFGTLVHAALERWGREEAALEARTMKASAIEKALHDHLDKHVAEQFPRSVRASVRVQVELARRRLTRFAELQAEQAANGWRVLCVEQAFEDDARGELGEGVHRAPDLMGTDHAVLHTEAAPVAGRSSLRLTGRIDRIDVHEQRGVYRALDYKTSSKAAKPKTEHLVSRGPRKGQWKDLQLPLYRVLMRSMPTPIAVDGSGLGYINLAPNRVKSAFEMLGVGDDLLEQAEAQAAAIVGRILAGDFTPAERIPVRAGDALAPVWGLGLRVVDDEGADSEAAGESGGEP